MYPRLGLYINGEWITGERECEPVINPATGETIATLPHANDADLQNALQSAEAAIPHWRITSPNDRAKILHGAASLIRERAETIAHVMTVEQGKTLAESRIEVAAGADTLDWMAEEGRRAYGRIIPAANGLRQMVVQEPVGVAVAFTPWNFPMVTPARKIAAALAAGCTLIIKPSEETPGTCVELVRCLVDAGLPKGVCNMVFGVPAKVSERLVTSKEVKKISFTGSVPVGKHLAGLAARGMKRATMELGGHAPVVVFADADPDKSAATIAAFKYRNAGQVCISPTRFYIHQDVFKTFADRFCEYAKGLVVGDGLANGTTMGPLANERRLDAMDAFVSDAKARGGRIMTGGNRLGNEGFFFEPTVILDLPDDAKIMVDEPFGPIAPIVPFRDFDEVVERANALDLGLAAYAFTTSTTTANAIASSLQAGMVGINSTAISTPETPFGGVKQSGYGQECGIEGLEAYTNKKFISIA